MTLSEVPEDAIFLDVDGIAVVRLPSGRCIAFGKSEGADSYPYPNEQKAGMEGDQLTRAEFADWLRTGLNRFDVRR